MSSGRTHSLEGQPGTFPVLHVHPAVFRHSLKPEVLLVLSEYPKSAWPPSIYLPTCHHQREPEWVGQDYGLAQAFSATKKPASLPVLCLNTAAGHGASATEQEPSCSSLPQEALGTCQSCRVICPQSSASNGPSFQPMCHFSLCLSDHRFASGEKLQQHQLPRAACQGLAVQAAHAGLTGGQAGDRAPNRWWQKELLSHLCHATVVRTPRHFPEPGG